ncbi:MAG: hypothetical protein J0H72_08835 [Burkholderiales bacterium]|nr:hypothetical protein [Burkholderiales bacterium]
MANSQVSKERKLRCLFCKADSSTSRSREHIVPESFGNTEHMLEPGVICDGCNNYFARKVEKPILDSLYFKERRFNAVVPNKRGHVVPLDGFHLESGTRIQVYADPGGGISVGAHPDADEARLIKTLLGQSKGTLIFPVATSPEERVLARFVGKIGIEVMASRLVQAGKSHEELVDEPALEELRNFVRRGGGPRQWSVARRQLYSPDTVFSDGDEHYVLLHEYELLLRPIDKANDLYACYISLVLFGEEFVLNMSGPALDGFEAWRASATD